MHACRQQARDLPPGLTGAVPEIGRFQTRHSFSSDKMSCLVSQLARDFCRISRARALVVHSGVSGTGGGFVGHFLPSMRQPAAGAVSTLYPAQLAGQKACRSPGGYRRAAAAYDRLWGRSSADHSGVTRLEGQAISALWAAKPTKTRHTM